MSEKKQTPVVPLFDVVTQAKKLAHVILEPYLTPEVEKYLTDPSKQNFEKAKDILSLPAFRTALNYSLEIAGGKIPLDPWLGFLPPATNSPEEKEAAAAPDGKKHPGAPLGNNNAYKHGFYARRLPGSHVAGLEYTGMRSLEDEITVLRTVIRHPQAEITTLLIFLRRGINLGGSTEDLSQAINLLRIISLATMGINRLMRTQLSIADPYNEPMDKLRRALEEMEDDPDFQRLDFENSSSFFPNPNTV